MSSALFPAFLARPYTERFVHRTAGADMGGGRRVTSATLGSSGLFAAEGLLFLPQGANTFDTLAAFVAARRGAYDSFLYLPAHDYHGTSSLEAVGTGDGSTVLFALDYKYPKTGTFTLTVNGVAKTEGTHWNLADSASGSFSLGEAPYVLFTGGNTPALGHLIVATYKFYIPVRFEDDDPLGSVVVLNHTGDSSADTFQGGPLRLLQDFAGSHLTTVPTP